MPPRKAKKKPFNRTFVGCWTCRRRKVKCDATRPHCIRCSKSANNLVCEGYDVKLNWATPLTANKRGELKALDGSSGLNEPDISTTFKRNNIELCRWTLYQTYQEIDQDLQTIDDNDNDVESKGPFTVFRYKLVGCQNTQQRLQQHKSHHYHHHHQEPSPQHAESPSNISHSDQKMLKSPQLPANSSLVGSTNNIFTKEYALNSMTLINHYIAKIPYLFNITVKSDLSTLIKVSIGEFLLDSGSLLEKCFLTSIVLITLLQITHISDNTKMDEIMELRNETLNDLKKIGKSDKDLYVLIHIHFIIINSVLDEYDPLPFLTGFSETTSSPYQDYYEFLRTTDQLYNHSNFTMDPKFTLIYEDILDSNYNLLRNFDYIKNKKKKINNDGKIIITKTDTPLDQIIRIPKHRNQNNNNTFELSSDESDSEPPPPTFTIHFSNEDEDNNSDNELEEEITNEPTEPVVNDNSPDHIFTLKELNDDVKTVMGISKHLLVLYTDLVQLINHKRLFIVKNSQQPRNFPKLCSEFEDTLLRSVKYHIITMDVKDDVFYNFLIFLFFKFIKNYPTRMLNFHLNKFKQNDLGLGVLKFFGKLDNEIDDDEVVGDPILWGSEIFLDKRVRYLQSERKANRRLNNFDDWTKDIKDRFFFA